MNGNINYITENGDLEIVFNAYHKDFKDGTYDPKKGTNLDFVEITKKTIPTKAIINLVTGEVEMKQILRDEDVQSISLLNAQELDEPGKYKVILNKSKDSYISIVDFKED